MYLSRYVVLFLILASVVPLSAGVVTVDFEGLSDSTAITNQYAGILFSNAIVLTAGVSLNEFEFPPHSGVNVVSDNGGPMSISFLTPVSTVLGYFTYLEPLTLTGFDTTNNVVATATSAFSNNAALSGQAGSSPNELLSLSFAAGISSMTITGDPAGGSFVLDDLTITSATESPVPEPSSFLLAAPIALFALAIGRRLKACR